MNKDQIIKIQKIVGVNADGVLGKDTLTAIFKKLGANNIRASELGLAANVHMRTYKILDNVNRFVHFLAQVAHESGNFIYMEEIASGAAYEGRKDLGNVHSGDGKRYKGRGSIQLTGRANYRKYGQALGLDFENHPDMVAYPSVGILVACKYWSDQGLNELADQNDILSITKKINGGVNGLEDRKKHLAKLKGWV
ncbi:glycoside hydrolase family 19 protein [Acinetobacter sp. Marseille-Q1618]|uniref:glycoside hydrolase family 19 protein n=1 Tax=Acinetobacter sp. Marseille-Q1618 TaxID=2697502 RepID=UPI001570CDF7|nr:glycoside hydrolase family 19 protein [Acinetobacter sp. Marseille-Q1618]